jgi:hypothetical protein
MKLLKTFATIGVVSIIAATSVVTSLKSVSAVEGNTLGVETSHSDFPMLISIAPNWQVKFPKVQNATIEAVTAILKPLAKGNDGDAWVEALEIRGTGVYLRAKIRHRQITRLPFGKKVTTYSLHNTVETSFDPLNPSSSVKNSHLCADNPPIIGGKSCVSGSSVVEIITKFLI